MVKKRHAEELTVWKATHREKADSLINDVNIAKVEAFNMSVDRNLILARYEEHVQTLQDMVNLKVERKLTFTDTMTQVCKLHNTGRWPEDRYVGLLF